MRWCKLAVGEVWEETKLCKLVKALPVNHLNHFTYYSRPQYTAGLLRLSRLQLFPACVGEREPRPQFLVLVPDVMRDLSLTRD